MSKAIDIAGKRFGRLVAIEPTKGRRDNSVIWKCKCDCGKDAYVAVKDLKYRENTSCGCSRIKDLKGYRVGRLLVIEATNKRSGTNIIWKCQCDCGNVTYVSSGNIVGGKVKSCGCLQKEKNIEKLNEIRNDTAIQEKRKSSLGYHDGTMEKMLSDKPTNANKTGVRGVTYNNTTGKYRAMIRYKRKLYHIGCFDSLKEAKEARKIAEKEIWGKEI